MIQQRSIALGLLAGGTILATGLALIFSKEWAWSLFEGLYSVLGIQGQRTRLWEMFVTTIGLFVLAIGLYILFAVWQRWRIGR